MIRGIGVDIVDITRIAQVMARSKERFLRRVFTEPEIAYCSGMAIPAIHFSGRWAAKEAFYKALPDHCQPFCSWKDLQIINNEKRKPTIEIISHTLSLAIKDTGIKSVHISLSHEHSHCVAFVVLE